MSEMEQAQYSEYELRPVAMAYVNDVEITSSDILSLCNCIDEEIYDTHVVRTYTTDKVREFIKDCKKITSVSSLDNLVYVTYVTNDDYEVVLGYSEDGLEEKCVYNPQEDSAVSITQEEGLLYSNLRYGNQYEMSDATLEYIENCIHFHQYPLTLEYSKTLSSHQPTQRTIVSLSFS